MNTPTDGPDDSPLKPITPRTLSDQATERLRLAIQTGLLAPGGQLVERELAAQLGMSRVPVREAIQRLAEEGLVKKTANRGAMVYLPSPEEIEEITSVRIVLEQFVAELVTQRWTRATDATFCLIVDQMRAGVHAKDRARLSNLDTEFHAITWQVAGHSVLTEVVSSLRQRVTRLLFETIALMTDEALPGVVESHERLIAVFRAGDTAQAREEMREHITKGKDRIMAVYQRRFQL
jgi:DNA-binding GntR family transcriptional regulator